MYGYQVDSSSSSPSSNMWVWMVGVVVLTTVSSYSIPDTVLFSAIPLLIAVYIFHTERFAYGSSSKDTTDHRKITIEDMRKTLLIDNQMHWLEHDTFLGQVVVNMHRLIQYDVQIVKDVTTACNDFVQVYYRGIAESDEDALSYSKLPSHRMRVQLLEDTLNDVVESLDGFRYVLKKHDFESTYNIPEVIHLVHDYMVSKIELLVTKYKLNNKERRLGAA